MPSWSHLVKEFPKYRILKRIQVSVIKTQLQNLVAIVLFGFDFDSLY